MILDFVESDHISLYGVIFIFFLIYLYTWFPHYIFYLFTIYIYPLKYIIKQTPTLKYNRYADGVKFMLNRVIFNYFDAQIILFYSGYYIIICL